MAMVYIPSTIHTVLKFRSGVIPSLMDPYFITYRKALHLTTFMVGAMFWGHVATTFAVAVLIAGAVFLLTWHVSISRRKVQMSNSIISYKNRI